MKTQISILAAVLMTLTACGDDNNTAVVADEPVVTTEPAPAPATTTLDTETRQETREAVDAIGEAGRATSDAVGAAARDVQERAGPALERAGQEGTRMLNEATEGLNNLARGAACETARAANDVEGIAANC